MIREAGPGDRAALEALLARQIDLAMFPLANLRSQGLGQGGFPSDHSHATRFWFFGDHGLVALSQGGMLMPVFAEGSDLSSLRPALSGLSAEGAIGPSGPVRALLAALDLVGHPARKNADEPAFTLDLRDLRIPDQTGARLVPLGAGLRALLIGWRTAAKIETEAMPAATAKARAAADIDAWIARGSHRVLLLDGAPVALTGFNAALPDIVQVGGVFTPPALRDRGYARLAVALHLAEARDAGVARAVLFAASLAAASAYRAIGFQANGSFALVLFASPVTIPV